MREVRLHLQNEKEREKERDWYLFWWEKVLGRRTAITRVEEEYGMFLFVGIGRTPPKTSSACSGEQATFWNLLGIQFRVTVEAPTIP